MLKKRLIFTLLYVLILNTVIVFADESNIITCSFDGGNITFDTSTGTIIKADETIKISAIPSEINGFSVKCIGDRSFVRCNNIINLSIPDTVVSIEECAFANCVNLQSVSIPNSVTKVGGAVFLECINLDNIVLPASIKAVSREMFDFCEKLTNIYISEGIEIIEISAFANCKNLSKIILPNSIRKIQERAFENDIKLASVNMPNDLEYVGSDAFNGTTTKLLDNPNCKKLKNINGVIYSKDGRTISYVPNDVTGEFEIPNTVTNIGRCAFSPAESGLTSVKIPSSIKTIDKGAFYYCRALTSIKIPAGIDVINESTFLGCSNLNKISLPSTIKKIGSAAFLDCSSLKNIELPYYLEKIELVAFEKTGLTEIIIPENVYEIGNGAFFHCDNLEKVVFKGNVKSLGIRIFDSCPNLTIYGYRNTNIQKYANENNIPFVEITDINNESTTIRGFVLNADNPLTINDGAMFYDILKNNKLGNINESDIHTLIQPDKRSFDMVIDLISNASDDNDITYFYYSGHGGMDENNIPFICPDYYHIDKEHDHDMTYYYTYPDLINKLDSIKGKVVIILDCCFSGYINESVYNLNKDKFKILTACKGKEYSSIEDILSSPFYNVTHGIFSSPLIEGLGGYNGKIKADTNKDNKVTLSELYKYIDKNMKKNWKVKDEKTNKVYSYTQNPTVSDPNDDMVIYSY